MTFVDELKFRPSDYLVKIFQTINWFLAHINQLRADEKQGRAMFR